MLRFLGKYKDTSSLGVKGSRYNRETGEWKNINVLAAMIERRNNQYRPNNPFDVVPYLVTSLKKPSLNPIFREGIFTRELGLTMRDILKTNTGKNYISQFMKKNHMFYGYKARGDGKYSDVILNIVQFELDKDNKMHEGAIGFASREGNVTLSESNSGKLMINIYTNQSDIDAISHELFVHNAGSIEEIIQGFRRGGLKEAERIKGNVYSTDEDHIALRDLDSNHKGIKMYKKLTEELENVNPKYKEVFNKVEEVNQIKYENLK